MKHATTGFNTEKSNMAVLKHELVHDNRNQLDLTALAQYIQLMNNQPAYLPPANELIKNCQDIVKCLAHASSNEEHLWSLLQSVEEFLLRIMSSCEHEIRHEIVTAILDKFYSYISDPQSDACPAASVVLVVLDSSNTEASLSAARWLVQQSDNGPAGAGLRASLSCLYCWLCEWRGTPGLGDWVMAFIGALEENEYFEILNEVSLDNISRLFLALDNPVTLRQSVADVIFHILASLRESTEAFDRISANVGRVLTNLASDSGQWSRQLLQNVVDILTATMNYLISCKKGQSQEAFKEKYKDVAQCLERHMASGECRYLQMAPWRTRSASLKNVNTTIPLRKVGLLNLGNTCYMNSVMQALFVSRQFSNHVVLKMTAVPYWSKMGILFGKMMHSVSNKLDPDEFFSYVKPPFFSRNHQHDSSEFLGYLFELLQSYEHHSEVNFDYSLPPVLATHSRLHNMSQQDGAAHSSSNADQEGPVTSNRRSVSPRPSSSAAGSSTSGQKRSSSEPCNEVVTKKRMCESSFLHRDSYIDNMFGGVLLTRIKCSVCHSSSLSQDVFRDLQLAFPSKPDNWQHNVQSLLDYYCSKEKLTGDNQYQCHDCGCLRDAERSVAIESTPKYLILILKNFKFNPKLEVQTKLMLSMFHNDTIVLPTVRTQMHCTYNLYAAVIHAGTTLNSGHYYTLAKDNNQWHMYNDEVVSPTEETQLHRLNRSSTPYILFYRRTDVNEGATPSMEQLPPKVQESVLAHNKHCVDTARNACVTRP